jgi:Outer membrane protein beta-barrel family/Carboxypeptidase regulatory-like domain
MKKIYLAIFLLTTLATSAQKFSIKGTVSDTLNNSMPSATVMLLNPKDSSLVNFGVTNATGAFEIKNVNKGTYQLKISFVGFATFLKNFTTPETGVLVELGRLKLLPQTTDLDAVVIKGERNPVTVKRDTIEFNASSFKTKVNANVEDLLKKMPGIEVESDGTINAQGEQVQQVTVDGREFFGRDPKLATRNLPADAVEKVQVFDKKSDQSTFTGIDDGTKTKTINLELKEEKRNAAFGSLMAGAGTNDRFTGKASINRFNKGSQLSFLGMGNNINEQGFSIGDAMNFSGGGQQMAGGGGGTMTVQIGGGNNSTVPLNFGGRQNGIMTNYAGGLNFNKDLNDKKTQVGGNYFYSRLDQNVIRDLTRINYLPDDSTYNFAQHSGQLSTSDTHRANLIVDHKIDSANSLKLNSSFSYSDAEQNNTSTSVTTLEDGTEVNNSDRTTYNASTTLGLNNNLLWRHRFSKKGRTLSTTLTLNVSQTDSKGNQKTDNNFSDETTQNIVQTNAQTTDNQTVGLSFSYTEPLGNRKYLEASYSYRTNRNEVLRQVFDENTGTPVPNAQLSNEYNSNYIYNRPGLNLRVNRQKYNFTMGVSYQNTRLKGDLIKLNSKIDNTFERVLPVARFNYDFTSFKHLRLDYETSMQEPSIQQLQPVVDNSDPLNVYVGNPGLKPAYAQTGSINFTTFDPAKFINFFALGSINYQANAIVNAQSVDSKLRRTTQPVNVKDALTANMNLNYGFRIQKLLSRINFGASASSNRSVTILNDQENKINTETIGGNARYNFTYKEIFSIDLAANIRNSATKYDFNTNQDQRFINSTYTAETNVTILKNYQLTADFNYYMYDSKTNNFNQTIPILNMWLSRFILKANAGEIKVGVSNLLDRSLSVTQTASANYLQQETINNLGRYLMVSFTYALNKQLNPFGGGGGRRPGGGMRMMIQN